MMLSCRQRTHSTMNSFQLASQRKIKNNKTFYDTKKDLKTKMMPQTFSLEQENRKLKEIIRQHELTILQLRNTMLKKDIQLNNAINNSTNLEKEIEMIKMEKQAMKKSKRKLQKQKHENIMNIQQLECRISQLKERLNEEKQSPKDHYQSCIRELDQLKFNLDEQEDQIKKQRDFYMEIFEEVYSLVHQDNLTSDQLKRNLKILFQQLRSC